MSRYQYALHTEKYLIDAYHNYNTHTITKNK